jgi:hypothetical protein
VSGEKRYLVQISDTKIRQTLKAAGGNVKKAAAALSVGWSTFYRRLKAMRQNEPAKPGKPAAVKKAPVKKKAAAPAKKAPVRKKAAAPAKTAPVRKKAAAHAKKAPGKKKK